MVYLSGRAQEGLAYAQAATALLAESAAAGATKTRRFLARCLPNVPHMTVRTLSFIVSAVALVGSVLVTAGALLLHDGTSPVDIPTGALGWRVSSMVACTTYIFVAAFFVALVGVVAASTNRRLVVLIHTFSASCVIPAMVVLGALFINDAAAFDGELAATHFGIHELLPATFAITEASWEMTNNCAPAREAQVELPFVVPESTEQQFGESPEERGNLYSSYTCRTGYIQAALLSIRSSEGKVEDMKQCLAGPYYWDYSATENVADRLVVACALRPTAALVLSNISTAVSLANLIGALVFFVALLLSALSITCCKKAEVDERSDEEKREALLDCEAPTLGAYVMA